MYPPGKLTMLQCKTTYLRIYGHCKLTDLQTKQKGNKAGWVEKTKWIRGVWEGGGK